MSDTAEVKPQVASNENAETASTGEQRKRARSVSDEGAEADGEAPQSKKPNLDASAVKAEDADTTASAADANASASGDASANPDTTDGTVNKEAAGEDAEENGKGHKNGTQKAMDVERPEGQIAGGAVAAAASESGANQPSTGQDGDVQMEGTSVEPGAEAQAQVIQMRALIVTQDASIIIGRQGKHIHEIREKSGARVNVSEAIPGNQERILNVGGALDAVSKAFGLIVRRINDEPFDVPSVPGSRAVNIRFIIANSRMGSVIGKSGGKIKEIQEASGARLQASEAMLPGSTERVLTVSGVADAIHIAVYYIGTILLEHSERAPHNTAYRQTSDSGGGSSRPPPRDSSYGYPPSSQYGGYGVGGGGGGMPPSSANAPGSQTQQIFIPNELVGSIIGKGGQKINEIRQMSMCQIKIMEPGEGGVAQSGERLVVITGQPVNISKAISLLSMRLDAEKAKLQSPGGYA